MINNPFSDNEIAELQLTQDQQYQEATNRYFKRLSDMILKSQISKL